MVTADQLPSMDDTALANLRANAARLQSEGGARREAAAALLPLIEAEIAERRSRMPAKPAAAARPSRTRSAAPPRASGKTSRAQAPKT